MNQIEEKLKTRNKKFAHNCVKIASELTSNKLGNHISGQLIRCSTSVPANYRAASVAQSKKAFIAKLGIVIEEADESNFWLEFIFDEKLHKDFVLIEELMNEANELTKIYTSSRITMSKTLSN